MGFVYYTTHPVFVRGAQDKVRARAWTLCVRSVGLFASQVFPTQFNPELEVRPSRVQDADTRADYSDEGAASGACGARALHRTADITVNRTLCFIVQDHAAIHTRDTSAMAARQPVFTNPDTSLMGRLDLWACWSSAVHRCSSSSSRILRMTAQSSAVASDGGAASSSRSWLEYGERRHVG